MISVLFRKELGMNLNTQAFSKLFVRICLVAALAVSLSATTTTEAQQVSFDHLNLTFSDPLPTSAGGRVFLDMAAATTGNWDDPDPSGLGIYDPEKFCVVYKWNQSRRIALYRGHPSGAPVMFLIDGGGDFEFVGSSSGGSTSYGNLRFNNFGKLGTRLKAFNTFPEAGIGGSFMSPLGGRVYPSHRTPGIDPNLGLNSAVPHPDQTMLYGNSRCVPLLGGTLSSNQFNQDYESAGGAVCIIASGTINLRGTFYFRPTDSYTSVNTSDDIGSGGTFRVVATTITSSQGINEWVRTGPGANNSGNNPDVYTDAGMGWCRFESYNHMDSYSGYPLIPLTATGIHRTIPDNPVVIWPEDLGFPTASIFSVGEVIAPTDPLDTATPDINLVTVDPTIPVIIRTVDANVNHIVQVRVGYRTNLNYSWDNNIVPLFDCTPMALPPANAPLNDPPNVMYWQANVPLLPGTSSLMGVVR